MDLHIHSCLSPCGDYTMSPGNVIARAMERGMDLIGISDHNSAENAGAFIAAGSRAGLAVLGGMEVCSREEAHLLVLFDEPAALAEMQGLVYASLEGRNDARAFGEQVVVDEHGNPVELNERLLIGATGLAAERIAAEARGRGGLVFAAHVDRPSFSLLGQLGFIPEGCELDGLELSPRCRDGRAYERWGRPLVRFSDAHTLADVARAYTELECERVAVAEIREALRGGRA